jgi:hypothetical protein
MSNPMTRMPAAWKALRSGSPTYPNPITPTTALPFSIFDSKDIPDDSLAAIHISHEIQHLCRLEGDAA